MSLGGLNMKLSVLERLILLNILPLEGDYITLKIVRDLRNGLSFSEDEHKEFKFQTQKDGSVEWDDKIEQDKDITVGEKARQMIVDILKRIDSEKKLTLKYMSLYEKFII